MEHVFLVIWYLQRLVLQKLLNSKKPHENESQWRDLYRCDGQLLDSFD